MIQTEEITKKYLKFGEKMTKISPKKKKKLLVIFWILVIGLFFVNPIFSITLIVLFIGIRATIQHFAFMKQFAEENGLEYQPWLSAKNFQGRLFSISNSETASNALLGEYQHCPFKIFNYSYTIGSGKNSHTYLFTAAEIEIPEADFPFILLRSKTMPVYLPWDLFQRKNDVKISIEPEFQKNYSLHTTAGYEIECLEIFTKDLLIFLREIAPQFSVEFAENKLYIYDDRLIRDKKDLTALFDLMKRLIEKIAPALSRMRDDFSALHSYYDKKRP
ncbi:MAG TPA: hypothetical protein P5328_02190 [Candidatus Paceibacterota bacterium]|nr:hypothetical protein [Candidatus Paceibacterota bacterium]HRZ34438.1 hypothetical protein [Candidatus Paceibacterota bacterium]